ncbi:SGNH/GDSL hydrolase family protein [Pseudarcicella hirudinis]|uniref:SGNH/GDSL hydrolase family protein n=1 Tax=Pseudarcicella hirudinis TaxID=1079859 RepID=UPI0035E7AB5F
MKVTYLFFSVALFITGYLTTPEFSAKKTILGDINNDSLAYKVLILGNSMTKHEPNQALGWKGNWGMAASSEENDYVHLLIKKFREKKPNVNVEYFNVAQSFERAYWKFDLKDFSQFRSFNPDLLIIRLGENVPADSLAKYSFKDGLKRLSDYITSGNKNKKVCVSTRFWPNKLIDDQIKNYAAENNCILTNLSQLSGIDGSMATGKFENKGVAMHPSDDGMKMIAESLWKGLKIYNSFKDNF